MVVYKLCKREQVSASLSLLSPVGLDLSCLTGNVYFHCCVLSTFNRITENHVVRITKMYVYIQMCNICVPLNVIMSLFLQHTPGIVKTVNESCATIAAC
jgi:hypothetical protein